MRLHGQQTAKRLRGRKCSAFKKRKRSKVKVVRERQLRERGCGAIQYNCGLIFFQAKYIEGAQEEEETGKNIKYKNKGSSAMPINCWVNNVLM
jgi:hypothetical protein